MKKTPHIVIDGATNEFVCNHCQQRHAFKLPLELKELSNLGKAFIKLHRNCKTENTQTLKNQEA